MKRTLQKNHYCVMKCRNDDEVNISYHRFPTNEKLKALWIEATNIKNFEPAKYTLLCSLHFEEKYIDRFHDKGRLRKLAIPTMFDHANDELIQNVMQKYELEFRISNNSLLSDTSNSTLKRLQKSSESKSFHDLEYLDDNCTFTNFENSIINCPDKLGDSDDSIEFPGNRTYRQYRSIDWDESTSKILTNLESTCRLCMAPITALSDIGFLSLFNSDEIPINLVDLDISIDDGLPQQICWNCSHILEETKTFFKQAKRSQEILRKHFNAKIEIDIDPVDEISIELNSLLNNGSSMTDNFEGLDTLLPENSPWSIKSSESSDGTKLKNKINRSKLLIENTYHCDICKKNFRTKYYLIRHMRSHSTAQIEKHENSHNGSNCKSYLCYICGRGFRDEHQYTLHANKHESLTKKYGCDKCDEKFTRFSSFTAHKLVHTKPLKCDMCGHRFAQRTQLNFHIRSKHVDNVECATYKCTICPRSFRLPSSLTNHMDIHNDEHIYECTTCDGTFKTFSDVKRHIRFVHMKEKPFRCNVCNRSFAVRPELVQHMTSHIGNSP